MQVEPSFSILYIPQATFIAMVSVIIAELMRDSWHVLCHRVQWLHTLFHRWHHIAYSRDFNIRSEALWRKSQWRHGLPEALIMVGGTGVFFYGVMTVLNEWYGLPSITGLLYAVRELCFVVAGIFGYRPHEDLLHVAGHFSNPPSQLYVNRAYHWNHHFAQPHAYFGGLYTPIDQILGTALSFQRKRIALLCHTESLKAALSKRLTADGAIVEEYDEALNLSRIDILIADQASWSISKKFFDTVVSTQDVANKELWWLHTSANDGLPENVEQAATCTTRDITVVSTSSDNDDLLARQIVFQSKRHVRYILATNNPLVFLLHRPHLILSSLWTQQVGAATSSSATKIVCGQ